MITCGLDHTLPDHRVHRGYPQDSSDIITSEVPFSNEYALHVESFAERHLSYQGDVLKAFAAVMSDMTTNLGFCFRWGMPTQIFELALCWTPCIALRSPDVDVSLHDHHVVFPTHQLSVQRRNRRQGFPSWSWTGHRFEPAVLYSSEVRSILQSRESVVLRITWPWDPAYHAPDLKGSDILVDGILDIEVELATMTKPEHGRSFLLDDDNTVLHFDDFSTWEVTQGKTCFRICEAVTTSDVWDPYDSAGDVSEVDSENEDSISKTTLSVLLTVLLNDDDIYERDGLFVVLSSEWDAQQPQCQ